MLPSIIAFVFSRHIAVLFSNIEERIGCGCILLLIGRGRFWKEVQKRELDQKILHRWQREEHNMQVLLHFLSVSSNCCFLFFYCCFFAWYGLHQEILFLKLVLASCLSSFLTVTGWVNERWFVGLTIWPIIITSSSFVQTKPNWLDCLRSRCFGKKPNTCYAFGSNEFASWKGLLFTSTY